MFSTTMYVEWCKVPWPKEKAFLLSDSLFQLSLSLAQIYEAMKDFSLFLGLSVNLEIMIKSFSIAPILCSSLTWNRYGQKSNQTEERRRKVFLLVSLCSFYGSNNSAATLARVLSFYVVLISAWAVDRTNQRRAIKSQPTKKVRTTRWSSKVAVARKKLWGVQRTYKWLMNDDIERRKHKFRNCVTVIVHSFRNLI